VRNAVDHGIETPETRLSVGKDPEGRLFLNAFHEGGQVIIEITDDGAGLDTVKVRDKAVQKALISADHAACLTEREITNLIFEPGFSTAATVTNVSGRGVGMDVVKTNIEKIGGTVEVQSRLGQGCTVRMKIPLTLAIIPALIVTTGGDRYALPQASLMEMIRLEGKRVRQGVEWIQGAAVTRLRERLLPVVYLDRELRLNVEDDKRTWLTGDEAEPQVINIVVLRADGRQFGLIVDEINDTEEIVVKPLSHQLKGCNTYAGAAIMGDGRVALILDILGLAQRARVASEVPHGAATASDQVPVSASSFLEPNKPMLLFQCGERSRMAVDLSLVSRLEEFSPESVEISADHEVVQYRGEIMPLVRVSEALEHRRNSAAQRDRDSMQVVVYSKGGHSVGLVVDRIVDIVDEPLVVQQESGRIGILGSAVIQKQVTDILDVQELLTALVTRQWVA
jgi:two-component system chemotaxis sensor kinase CheA